MLEKEGEERKGGADVDCDLSDMDEDEDARVNFEQARST